MNNLKFYIDGAWVDPITPKTLDVIDPSTEEAYTQISMGSAADIDRAVAAAKAAFPAFAATSRAERVALLKRVVEIYERRYEEFVQAISQEMGAPVSLARDAQAAMGPGHLRELIRVLETYEFEEMRGSTMIVREPIGVCGLITPWNWPINQIACKVGPALAAGCTMVLKPSEIAPIDALLIAEVLHEAGVPKGVFNLVNGDGPTAGAALSAHPDVDMMSFTGSTRAGIQVAKAAADTVKRVSQELGGKSANILLADVDFQKAVTKGIAGCFGNSGQSCNAPTRMFVPSSKMDDVKKIAKAAAETYKVGDPRAADTKLGPVVSQIQFDKIQDLIQSGIDEGAELLTGGTGRPEGLNRGYFIRPTVFANVKPSMRIAREEIFGPVLAILPYETVDEVVAMANDTVYGLSSYVQSADLAAARKVAAQMRAGDVRINYPAWDWGAPFGGYKQSGNGREYSAFGLEEFLETKAIIGYAAA
ncbi:aldehyde dehydrogenase family protein [Pseudoroseomonas deserti]|uniref:aldehyde dehydrogenase (NAD(+)) n=1 Tax=Teichococcus deserti TaxID=1817963 RepID=A0A1V2H782_9PROT|nr:aldehyde dehydrogenase family protein [Pseudoroseomonas deserti]ONG57018.1 aldehyde dehydrogenase family protein [Pseudoroseomonas deserti]